MSSHTGYREESKRLASASTGASPRGRACFPRRFLEDRSGNVALIFGVGATAIMGMIALGIDYGRAVAVRSDLQHTLDSAVLAATSATGNPTAEQRQTIAANFFNSVVRPGSATINSTSFHYDSTASTLTARVTATESSTLGKMWSNGLPITVSSTAVVAGAKTRALDVVMCIDATGSMTPTLSAVQTNALNFKSNLETSLTSLGISPFARTRVRVIYFRDYGGNGYRNLSRRGATVSGTALGDSTPINASDFYTLPADNNAFSNFVNATSASGGGDLPESGLECLNEAMHSAWTKDGDTLSSGKTVDIVVPVIAIYTDAGAHPPNFTWSVQNPSYPSASDMPRSYGALLAKWNNAKVIDQTNKMILFFGDPAKDDDYYFDDTSGWETIKTWPKFSNPGSLTSANTSFISTMAAGIASVYQSTALTR